MTGEGSIVRRVAAGDRAAIEQLYLRHSGSLARFCVRIAGNPDDAADLVQETFARFIRQSRKLDADAVRLPSYLFATAQNLQARSWRVATRSIALDAIAEPVSGSLEADPDRSLLLAEQRQEVRRATEALNDRQRSALALREIEELSYDEVGAILGINRNAVAQLLLRSRLRLRGALQRGQIDEERLTPEVRAALPALCAYADGELAAAERAEVAVLLARSAEARNVLEALLDAGRSYRGLVWLPVPLLGAAALAGVQPAAITAGGLITVLRTSSKARNVTIFAASAVALTSVAVAGVRLRQTTSPARHAVVASSTPTARPTTTLLEPSTVARPPATTPASPPVRTRPRSRAVPTTTPDATNGPTPAQLAVDAITVSGHVITLSVSNTGGAPSRRTAVTFASTLAGTLRTTLAAIPAGGTSAVRVVYPCTGQTQDRVTAHVGSLVVTADVALDCPVLAARVVIDAVVADGPTIRVTVHNAGGVAAPPSTVTATADGVDPLSANIARLEPGATTTVVLDWPCTRGAGEFTVQARDDSTHVALQFACP